ncbi:MAG: hypothetical protein WAM66_07010 [Acidobacteriaceae bacterium]
MSIQRTDPKKTARKKSEALAVKAPVPAPAPTPLFSKDKDGALQLSDECYAQTFVTFMGSREARRLLKPEADRPLKPEVDRLLKFGFPHSTTRLSTTLLGQVSGALPYGKGHCQDVEALTFALEAAASLKPRDGLEVMLCSQMVALHSQGLEYLRRTMIPEQTSEGVDCNVNRATRLLRTFATLAETLRAKRTAGRQKIVVEHVTVQAGGQAIVGAVTTGGRVGDAGKIKQ